MDLPRRMRPNLYDYGCRLSIKVLERNPFEGKDDFDEANKPFKVLENLQVRFLTASPAVSSNFCKILLFLMIFATTAIKRIVHFSALKFFSK